MTIKFLKEWGCKPMDAATRNAIQTSLDGGCEIVRAGTVVGIEFELPIVKPMDMFASFESPRRAISFAAALNKLRRPLRRIKEDLDADWSDRVKIRDACTCVGCGIVGAKIHPIKGTKDAITAHHWLITKARAGMARWARPCGVTYHFAEHIHALHENPCWLTMKPIVEHVTAIEGVEAIQATIAWSKVEPTEPRVRSLWWERCGQDTNERELHNGTGDSLPPQEKNNE